MHHDFTPNCICEQCDKAYRVRPSRISKSRFCSKTCHDNSMVKPRAILQSDIDRFWSKVDKVTHPNGCWLWTGAHDPKLGYGNFSIRTNNGIGTIAAYRFSMILVHGDAVGDLHVCHNCPGGDNPRCVNPDHLFLGTHTDNMRDMWAKGNGRKEWPIGDDVSHAVLTEAVVMDARQRYVDSDISLTKMAREYGVTRRALVLAINGANWSHLGQPEPTVTTEEAERIRQRRAFDQRAVRSKLTPKEVKEIRVLYAAGGTSYRRLADQFGVSHFTIESIVKRRIWAKSDDNHDPLPGKAG